MLHLSGGSVVATPDDADHLAAAFGRLRAPAFVKMVASLGKAIREERGAEAAADLVEAAGT